MMAVLLVGQHFLQLREKGLSRKGGTKNAHPGR
jgi:hypothetical protein